MIGVSAIGLLGVVLLARKLKKKFMNPQEGYFEAFGDNDNGVGMNPLYGNDNEGTNPLYN